MELISLFSMSQNACLQNLNIKFVKLLKIGIIINFNKPDGIIGENAAMWSRKDVKMDP